MLQIAMILGIVLLFKEIALRLPADFVMTHWGLFIFVNNLSY